MAGSYNGWSNYETWNVNLWLDNDEPMYRDVQRMVAREIDREDENEPMDEQLARLAESIREYVEAPAMFGDLLGAALGEVDWVEIATAQAEQ